MAVDTARGGVERHLADDTTGAEAAPGFVPAGVDARAWRSFEDRVLARRHDALIATADAALARGDVPAAQRALAEGRALATPEHQVLRDASATRAPVPEGQLQEFPELVWMWPAITVFAAMTAAALLIATFL